MAEPDWLPALVPFDWNRYEESLEAAYQVFVRCFGDVKVRPAFQGRRLGLKRHPELDGKSATFWHFVTEGNVEEDRTPVRSRIERIAWPHALIVEAGGIPPRVCVWCTERGRSKRWLIALEDFSYLVILDDRGEYLLPWTAYPVEHDHRREKLRKEHAAWRKGLKC
jgi:hypothetical protein